ncbi:MAG: hypothetical protein GTO03_18385 [Planctomycetales bacterium]|nr:hypothetical protein [Planctomycetales bacterium]
MNLLVVISLLAFAGEQAGDASPAADPREELPSAIEHALQLLQDEQHELFLQRFAVPADLKRVLDNRDLEDLVTAFAKEKAQPLQGALRQIQGKAPRLSEEGTRATFTVPQKNFPPAAIVFQKIDGLWYLRN